MTNKSKRQLITNFVIIGLLTIYIGLMVIFADRLLLPLLFGLGVILQSIFILRRQALSGTYLICILISLLGLLPGRRENVYSLDFHIVLCFVLFAMFLAMMFKNKLMIFINELTLFQITIILIYMNFVEALPSIAWLLPVLTYWSIIFVGLLLVSKGSLHPFLKIGLYIWFLIISTCILLIQFVPEVQAFFGYPISFTTINQDLLHSFVGGMLFLPLAINVNYLAELIPIPGKRQSFSDKMAEVKEHAKEMKNKYSDYQLTLQNAALVLFIQGGLLALNHQLSIIPAGAAIGLSFLLVDLMVFAHINLLSLLRSAVFILIGRQQSTS